MINSHPGFPESRQGVRHCPNKVKRILKHTEANKRTLALRVYDSMGPSPREAIPESFDEWLALTRED